MKKNSKIRSPKKAVWRVEAKVQGHGNRVLVITVHQRGSCCYLNSWMKIGENYERLIEENFQGREPKAYMLLEEVNRLDIEHFIHVHSYLNPNLFSAFHRLKEACQNFKRLKRGKNYAEV